MKHLLLAFSLLFIVSCGQEDKGGNQSPSQPGPEAPPANPNPEANSGPAPAPSPTIPVALTWEFSEGTCTTGKHAVGSLAEYCDEIQSGSKNHFCALEFRKIAFKSQCSGAFTEKP